MRFKIRVSILCPFCQYVLAVYGDEFLACAQGSCSEYGKRYALPQLELKPYSAKPRPEL